MQTLDAVVVCGDAGVGKTTYGKRLARSLGAAIVDIDTCTEAVVQAGLRLAGMNEGDRDSPSFKSAFRLPIHNALFAIARDQLHDAQIPVVLVAPLTQERKRADFVEFLEQRLAAASSSLDQNGGGGVHVRVHVVHIVCDAEVRRKRIVARGNPRDALKFASDYFKQVPGGEGEVLPCVHSRVSTSSAAALPSLVGPWTRQKTAEAAAAGATSVRSNM